MNDNPNTWVPIGTAMDAVLVKIRRQMGARIAREAKIKNSGATVVATNTRLRGAA